MQERARARRDVVVWSAVVAIAAVAGIVMVSAWQRHAEKVEATRSLASDIIHRTESAFHEVDALSAEEKSALRTYRNEHHLEAAEKYGIPQISSRTEAEAVAARRGLVPIRTSPLYRVARLDYSVPYLTPVAAELLDSIGGRFHQRLQAHGLPRYRILITSLTRSREDQEALRRINMNAAASSSHEFGTTFDLHYDEFDYVAEPADSEQRGIYPTLLREMLLHAYRRFASEYSESLKAVLGQVLLHLQEEEKALVIYERRQPVFHVTAARPVFEALPPRDIETPAEGGQAAASP